MLRVLAGVVVMAALVGCGSGAPKHDPEADKAAIVAALQRFPQDFNAERIDEVCGLFADDVVLSYPDSPDRDHEQFCARTRQLFDDPTKAFTYDAPVIKEVVVDGDLATVRLDWHLTVRDVAGAVLETVVEDGLDVFQRQADGTWKIHVSHAFTRDGD